MASKLGGYSLIRDPPIKWEGSFDPPDPPGSPPLDRNKDWNFVLKNVIKDKSQGHHSGSSVNKSVSAHIG